MTSSRHNPAIFRNCTLAVRQGGVVPTHPLLGKVLHSGLVANRRCFIEHEIVVGARVCASGTACGVDADSCGAAWVEVSAPGPPFFVAGKHAQRMPNSTATIINRTAAFFSMPFVLFMAHPVRRQFRHLSASRATRDSYRQDSGPCQFSCGYSKNLSLTPT